MPAGTIAVALVWAASRDTLTGTEGLVLAIRGAGVFLAVACAFAFDDAAATTTESCPTPLVLLRALRIALLLPVVAVWWTVVLIIANQKSGLAAPLPFGALTLEAATLVMVTLAATAVASRKIPGDGPSVVGTGVLLGVLTVTFALPPQATPWVNPGAPRWGIVHWWWLAALAIASALLMFSSMSGKGRWRLRPGTSHSGRSAARAVVGGQVPRQSPPE